MTVTVAWFSHPLNILSCPSTCYSLPSLGSSENRQMLFSRWPHTWALYKSLLVFDTGRSLFTLNLCCRLFATVRTGYMTSTYCSAMVWQPVLKDLAKELPVGCAHWSLGGERHGKHTCSERAMTNSCVFSPLTIMCSVLSIPSYPLVFPGLRESCFPVLSALFLCLNQLV